jgi:WD40 repeat protein
MTTNQFENEEPKWIIRKPTMADNWSACLQTLEGHNSLVYSVDWSHDATRLASASYDKTVKICCRSSAVISCECSESDDDVSKMVWRRKAVWKSGAGTWCHCNKIWDPATGQCVSTLKIRRPLKDLQFHESNSDLLHTELGTFNLRTVAIFDPASNDGLSPITGGYGLSSTGTWITYQGENLLWLPPECRPLSSVFMDTGWPGMSPYQR